MTVKRFYRIAEVSELLSVPATTLRWWEQVFPMLNPNRLPSGQRRYTQEDVELAKLIKELLYVRGMKVEGAIEYLNKTYRKYPPRHLRVCRTPEDAIALLDEVKAVLDDAHTIKKIEALTNWVNSLEGLKTHKDIIEVVRFEKSSPSKK